MECTTDYIELLFAGQFNKVDCIPGNADGELRIFFRMFHRIKQGFADEHVYIQMMTVFQEVAVKQSGQIANLFLFALSQCIRNNTESITDAVFCVILWQFCH